MQSTLQKDTEIHFPDLTVVTASAGSGKTYMLAMRYASFLLSDKIQFNALRNILAITFTNNAANEMKQRIIEYLKLAALGDRKKIDEFRELVAMDEKKLIEKAAKCVTDIFDNYSEFQVKTIDSFMTEVFKSSALEFGYNPDFDIALNNSTIIDYAFDLFLRELQPESLQSVTLQKAVALLSRTRKGDSSFIWNPYSKITSQVQKLYGLLGSTTKSLTADNQFERLETLRKNIADDAALIQKIASDSGLETKINAMAFLDTAISGDIEGVSGKVKLGVPLNKPKSKKDNDRYDATVEKLQPRCDRVNALVAEYLQLRSKLYFLPYIQSLGLLHGSLERAKKQIGQIFINEVNQKLSDHLRQDIIPEIYFKLGDRIYHYLIDEFQDTSPIQWENIRHLVENSLASYGSLFVVGDMKQAIYGFRGADWTIMAEMAQKNTFPSASHHVLELGKNRRSFEKIVRFGEDVFHTIDPQTGYAAAAQLSGLASYHQDVRQENAGKGIVDVYTIKKDDETLPEKIKLIETVIELQSRGFRMGDIAVLTPANDDVIEVGGWLNEHQIRFISHSSLDIRRRKVAGEIIALLKFLDSPIDDLSFLTFILGDVFFNLSVTGIPNVKSELANLFCAPKQSRETRKPYYQVFREKFPDVWNKLFEGLFNLVGYLPLYDLISAVYKTFRVYETCGAEEASFVKLLEVIKSFENSGKNNLKDFLAFAEDDEDSSEWKIDVPKNIDAVKLMTIHKAKGLQFRVVIVLLYEKRDNSNDYYLSGDGNGISILHINKDIAGKVESLGQVYAEQKLKNQVNDLNMLYVAFTRAQEEMYVLGVYEKEPKAPVAFLPKDSYAPETKPAILAQQPEKQLSIASFHHTVLRKSEIQTPSRLAMDEIARGEFIHLILSKIQSYDTDANSLIELLIFTTGGVIDKENTSETIQQFLELDTMRELFTEKPGREIFIEQDITDRNGRLFRIDRMVVDTDRITVIDFKTGNDEMKDKYESQVRNYLHLVHELYPAKQVHGLIAYIDLKTTTNVS
ncbi:MAG: UvrD-helicase domain-containing protein [Bacteroidota bacterium]